MRRLSILPAALVLAALLAPAAAGAEPPTLYLQGPTTVTEGARYAGAPYVDVVRSGDTSTAVSATVAVASGDPSEIASGLGRVVVPAGSWRTHVKLQLPDDDVPEPAKQLVLKLSDPTDGTSIGSDTLTMTIHDDDYVFTVPQVTVREDAGTVDLPLRRDDPSVDQPISLSIADGPLNELSVGSLALSAGDTAPHLTIGLVGNSMREGDRHYVVSLGGRKGAGSSLVLNVIDDDPLWTAPWVAPTATLRVPRRLALHRRPGFRAVCNKDCVVTAQLRLDPRLARGLHLDPVVALKKTRLLAATHQTVGLYALPSAIRRLRGRRPADARLVVVIATDQGATRTVVKHVTLTA